MAYSVLFAVLHSSQGRTVLPFFTICTAASRGYCSGSIPPPTPHAEARACLQEIVQSGPKDLARLSSEGARLPHFDAEGQEESSRGESTDDPDPSYSPDHFMAVRPRCVPPEPSCCSAHCRMLTLSPSRCVSRSSGREWRQWYKNHSGPSTPVDTSTPITRGRRTSPRSQRRMKRHPLDPIQPQQARDI